MLQEQYPMSQQNGMQRNRNVRPRIATMPQMGPMTNQRTQPMIMSIQPTVPASHTGVLVSMPSGPALISTASLPPQPKGNVQPVYHYENQIVQHTESEMNGDSHQSHQNLPNTTSISSVQPNNNNNSTNSTLANIKEKTPMCLVNELARYNKIKHEYQLTEETGPAHKKIFTVALKLGDEEYKSEGPSIKKAQHAAAALSLVKTEYKHPPSKAIENQVGTRATNPGVMTPTVELNALAMKRGERPIYMVENGTPRHPQGYINQPPSYYPRQNFYGAQNQPRFPYDTRRANMRAYYPYHDNHYYSQYRPTGQHNPGDPYTVRLRVGDREYPGVGYTVQAARHDAAAKAIDEIKQLGDCSTSEPQTENCVPDSNNTSSSSEISSELKSPISLVHEIALKRNLSVTFDVLSEKGPPHMKVFVTQCRVGSFLAEGEGNGKKISKKRAAEKMLDELSKLPPLPPMHNNVVKLKRKRITNKKKTRNLVKVNMDKAAEFTEEINPISRLIQIQQANKEREPVYTVVDERGAPRRREFVIQAAVNGHACNGVGPNKKVAKRNAAEALLILLGYTSLPSSNPKPALKTDKDTESTTSVDKIRKVTFVEDTTTTTTIRDATPQSSATSSTAATVVGGSGGRQLVPGILLVSDQSSSNNFNQQQTNNKLIKDNTNNIVQDNNKNQIRKKMPILKTPQQQQTGGASTIPGVRSKDQLLYLAQLMNIQVQFSDFPKANHEMYLTLVSLSTNPQQVCHGEGPTTEASHETAAAEALKVLSELGLDSVGLNNNNEGNSNDNNNEASSHLDGIKK